MSKLKSLTIDVKSPKTKRRRLRFELVETGFRVSWSSGNDPFQYAFRADFTDPRIRWLTPISKKYPDSSEKRKSDVGIPVWIYKFVLSYELEELRTIIEREGKVSE